MAFEDDWLCFTCRACGKCDETVPDPADVYVENGEDVCEECWDNPIGWGDWADAWPEVENDRQ